MAHQNWSTSSQDKPPVSWNGEAKTFSIFLSGLRDLGVKDTLEAEWEPPFIYVVRIKEVGSGIWSCGFETPLTSCGFVDLRPDTEYEIEVRTKNAHGVSDPTTVRLRTNPEGSLAVRS